jgi:hypothetical protein
VSWRLLGFLGRICAALVIANTILTFLGLSVLATLILVTKGKSGISFQLFSQLATIAIQFGVSVGVAGGVLIGAWDAVLRRKLIRPVWLR